MKISIINHCAHNKGDNSVLYFLATKLRERSDVSHVFLSSSDGEIPFWDKFNLFSGAAFWGSGMTFKPREVGFYSYFFLKIRNFVFKKFFLKLIVRCFANNYDFCARLLSSVIADRRLLGFIGESDAVISTGGHHLSSVLDKDGLNTQMFDMIITILQGKRLMLWSQSIGPIETDKKYVLRALDRIIANAKVIMARDENTLQLLGKRSNPEFMETICPDSVFGIPSLKSFRPESPAVDDDYALICIYTAAKRTIKGEAEYIQTIVKLIDFLSSKNLTTVLLPMQYRGLAGDERDTLRSISASSNSDKVIIVDVDVSPVDTLGYFSGAKIAIGHKTHSVVYGLAMAVPTVAICYHPKTRFFMDQFGLGNFSIDDRNLQSSDLIFKVDRALVEEEAIRIQLVTRQREVNDELCLKFSKAIDYLIYSGR